MADTRTSLHRAIGPGIPFLITPHDSNALSKETRAIAIGTAGDLVVTTPDGDDVTIPENTLAVGVQHSIRATHVKSTGTTASEIVGYY